MIILKSNVSKRQGKSGSILSRSIGAIVSLKEALYRN